MQRLTGAVGRARAHVERFPPTFRYLIAGQGAFSLGAGIYVPYGALYLTRDLHATGAQAGAILAAAGMIGLVGSPVGGVLADRIGRRPVMLVGLAGNSVLFILLGSVTSLLLVALIVPLWGIVGDLLGPAISASIADLVTDDEERVEAYALQRIVSNLTFSLGPPIGALIATFASLRIVLIAAGVMSVVAFVVMFFRVPETKPDTSDVVQERSRLGQAVHDRTLMLLALGAALGTFVYVEYNDALGVFLVRDRGYAAATWGLVFGINPILVVLLQYPIARWAAKHSARLVLAGGVLLYGAALAILIPFSPLPWLVVAVVVLVLGEMLIAPVASALAARIAPAHLRGSYQGVLNFAFAGAFGPAVFIGLTLVGSGNGVAMLVAALPIACVAAGCFLLLPPNPSVH